MNVPALQIPAAPILNETIYRDQKSWIGRLFRSISVFCKEKPLKGGALVAGLVAANIYNFATSYLLLKGSYLSLKETYHVLKHDSHLVPEPGDAGGWSSLAIFSTIAIGSLLVQSTKDGDYIRLKSLYKNFFAEAKERGVLLNKEEFYLKVEEGINAISSRTLFSRNLIDQKIYALNILKKLKNEDLEEQPVYGGDLRLDEALKKKYKKIQKKLNSKLSFRAYSSRLCAAFRGIKETAGTASLCAAIGNGIVIPSILSVTALLSGCGTVVLAKKVLFDKEEPLLTGHVGEWPINLVEAVFAFFYLHTRFVLNEGDFVLAKETFTTILARYQPKLEAVMYNRLCDLINAELDRLASQCSISKFDYKFAKVAV